MLGDLEYGLEKSDSSWNTVWANQWEPGKKSQYAFDCYVNHFGNETKYVNEDISTINKKDIPNHNLLVGGFPCQDFSIIWKQPGLNGKRGGLFRHFAEFVDGYPRHIRAAPNRDLAVAVLADDKGVDASAVNSQMLAEQIF